MSQPSPSPTPVADDPCPHCGQTLGEAWLVCAWCGERVAAPAELQPGATLAGGRYEILDTLGRGGFGITYEAGDTRLRRRVAVKELFPDAAVRHGSMVLTPPHARAAFRTARERFLREARVLARFTQPGIVRVYEVFEEHGTAYLVMERLYGRNLAEVMQARGRPFDNDELLDVVARVAAALRPVHAAGVLHRDINPANIMLTADGRIVVIDFGLARDFDASHTTGMTRAVTPGYAPLEQYHGEGRFGPATDVYGLAATCYLLATGTVPVAAVERHAGAALAAPHRVHPAVSRPVSDAILDGLELEPGHRPQDLDAFLSRLGITALPDTPRSVLLGRDGTAGIDAPPLAQPVPAPVPDAAPPAPDPAVVVGPEVDHTTVVRPAGPPPVPGDEGTVAWTAPPSAGTDGATLAIPPDDPQRQARVADQPAAPGPPATGTGLARPGRRKLVVPLVAAVVAAASAAPVLVVALLVLALVPALATVGDATARRLRAEHGLDGGWLSRRAPGALWLPVRFLRNLVVSVLRNSPILGVAAVLLALWYAVAQTSVPDAVLDVGLRCIGVATAGAVLAASREGSARFRSGLGLDDLVRRAVPDGRTTERLVVGWLLAVIVVAGSIWLSPDTFPLP